MTDHAVDAGRHQRMPGLDREQAAETMPEHEHRPESQRAAEGKQHDADPAYGIAVDGPEIDAVGVGREKGREQPDHAERNDDPAVAAILALAGTEITAGEERGDRQEE